ncbi:App1 family protein [Calidifontibacter terrae]
MAAKHPAARAEDAFNRALASTLRRRGFRNRVLGYTGYGSPRFARVMGRLVLSKAGDEPSGPLDAPVRRGIRAFLAAPQTDRDVTIEFGRASMTVRTDRGGYFDVDLTDHGLGAGWHHARVSSGDAVTDVALQIIGDDIDFGIISDIDDTCLITSLPRPMLAAYNTFVLEETARRVVPGMSALYRSLLAHHPSSPIIYLSTGAWNTQPVLARFFARHGFPAGSLLMTDWGATETAVFRSGSDHKRTQLRRLATEFPNIRWLLVGDDGQHDPELYDEFTNDHPDNVRAIAIRQLTVAQKVLSHGHPLSRDDGRMSPVFKVEGPDGFALHQELQPLREAGRA